ncbi:MAG: hypothetical protein NT076_02480 [Candidatus Pacearchaeota archaeon]|nr:hypothetical protein [Candidatus Pacearchaeota archaeon]
MEKNEAMIIGDYTWQQARDSIIFKMMQCQTEKDFIKFVGAIASSIGTKKEIERVRKRMGIHPLTKEELKKMGVKKDGSKT